MKTFKSIFKDIKNNQIYPVYFLYGEEFYFINQISNFIRNEILEEQDKIFNEFILYPEDVTDYNEFISLCKEFPMGDSKKKIIIIKEAQNYPDLFWNFLKKYFDNIQMKTVLIIEYKHKKLDKKKIIYKLFNKHKWIYECKKIYDDQLKIWILNQCKKNELEIDEESILILINFLGNNLSTINNELKKIYLFNNKKITAEFLKKKIFINKTYNIFDFTQALGKRNIIESFHIINFFIKNKKEFPIIKINYQIFYFFVQLMLIHTINNKSKQLLAKTLKINEFFIQFFLNASLNYQLEEIIKIINIIYQYDLKFKGITKIINISYQELFKDMIYKILTIKL